MPPINAALLSQRRRAGTPAWVATGAMAAVVVMGLALVALKPSRSEVKRGQGGPVSLLGYDPYTPVSKPGNREDIAGAWGEEGEEHNLPHWATDWPSDAQVPCEPGMQCMDHVGNPLGALGKWVMQATSLGDSTKREWQIRHNCVGLPGWAVEECMRMRQEEKKLGRDGHQKEATAPPAPEEGEEGGDGAGEGGDGGAEPAAKRSRTTVLAQGGGGGLPQRRLDAMQRRRAAPLQRTSLARGGGFAGGAQAAEQAGEVVVVPARDVRVM